MDGSLTKSKTASTNPTGVGGGTTATGKRSTFFWRGFSSPVGANTPAAKATVQYCGNIGGSAGRPAGGRAGSDYGIHPPAKGPTRVAAVVAATAVALAGAVEGEEEAAVRYGAAVDTGEIHSTINSRKK
jgi:hypothetical protein